MGRLLNLAGLLVATVPILATGGYCANYGGVGTKGGASIPREFSSLPQGERIENAAAHLLVRIEYPGSINPAALADLVNAFRRESPQLAASSTDEQISARLIDGINKSAFYAARLYRSLVNSGDFPKESVALSPVDLVEPRLPGQDLATQTQTSQVPAVVTVRMVAYRNAVGEVTKMVSDQSGINIKANTFGDTVTPLLVVATEPGAWPSSTGTILYWGLSSPIAPYRTCEPNDCVISSPDIGDIFGVTALHGSVGGAVSASRISGNLPYPSEVNIPLLALSCPSVSQPVFVACPHEQAAGALVESALRQANPYLATRFQWRSFIARYDPALAARWPGAAYDQAALSRLAALKKIMRAERTLLSRASDQLASQILDGSAGAGMRHQLLGEIAYGAAVAQQSQSSLSLASVLAIATSLSSFGKTGIEDQISAIQSESSRAQTEERIRAAGMSKIDASYDSSSSSFYRNLRVDTSQSLGSENSATSTTISQFQSKLKSAYINERFADLPHIDGSCRTIGNSSVAITDYNGDCDQTKLADARFGRGASVIRDPSTNIVTNIVEIFDGLEVSFTSKAMCGAAVCRGSPYVKSGSSPTSYITGFSVFLPIEGGILIHKELFGNPITDVAIKDSKPTSITQEQKAMLAAAFASWRVKTETLLQ